MNPMFIAVRFNGFGELRQAGTVAVYAEHAVPASMRLAFGEGVILYAPAFMLRGEPTEENILAAVLAYHETLKCDTFAPETTFVPDQKNLSILIGMKDPFQSVPRWAAQAAKAA
jgi:hypothetical protein